MPKTNGATNQIESIYSGVAKINTASLENNKTPEQTSLINPKEIEYVEINNILSVLSKKQILIIPGNIGISRTLKPQYYGSDGPEYLGFYLYKEFKKRRLKALCYIYKDNKENNDSLFSDKVESLIKSHNLSYTIKNL